MARSARRVYVTARVVFAVLLYFVLRAQPSASPAAAHIDGISPARAPIGAQVTITGIGFGAQNARVLVNGVAAGIVSATGNRVTFLVPAGVHPGAATVTLTNPGEHVGTIAFTIQDRPPVANAGASRTARATDVVPLDGSASSDPDGDALTYLWSVTAKPAGSFAAPLNAAAAATAIVVDLPGTYGITLTVSDGTLTNTASVTLAALSLPNPCLVNNGGCSAQASCANDTGVASCSCLTGYTGDGTTCSDINECLANNGGCDPLTTCANTPGSRICGVCPAGYTGDGAAGCVDINECATNNGGCDPLTTCTNTPGSRTCGGCPAGYTGDGAAGCVEINECLTNNGGCDAAAICTNTVGSRTCACPAGYSGDGLTCTPMDSCQIANGGCDATVGVCTSTGPGTNTCGCPAGYTGDGTTCADINECLATNGGCDPLAACTNTPGSRTCGGCPAGYTGDGTTGCVDINECLTNNGGCDPVATCTDTPGSRTCSPCPAGYTGTGDTACVDIDECQTNNGGCGASLTCVNTSGSHVCQASLTPGAALTAAIVAGGGTKGVAVADLNGDGKPDIIAVNSVPGAPSSVSIFNNRTATDNDPLTFDPKIDFPTGIESVDVTVADVNADGKPDLVVANFGANGTGTVSVLINTTPDANAPIAFAPAVAIDSPTASGVLAIAAADLNGDGVLDLVTSASTSNAITLYTNAGISPPTFTPRTLPSGGTLPVGLALGDLLGDHGLEIVVANAGDSITPGTVTVFRNLLVNGSYSLGQLGTFPAGLGAHSVVIADVNGDGKNDLAVTNQASNTVSVLLNTSTSAHLLTLAPAVDFPVPDVPNGLSVADVDSDGQPDLLVSIGTNSSSAPGVLELRNTTASGAPTPSFAVTPGPPDGVWPWAIAGVDLNGDGQPDAAVTNFTSATVAVFRNDTLPHLCATTNGGCDPLTTCTDTAGSRVCGACPAGYTGTGATGCTPTDVCVTNNGACDALTTCTSTGAGTRTCGECPAGYSGTGATGCVEIDECATNNGGCANYCANTIGSFQCVDACPAGYTTPAAPGECVDVNECLTNNGGCWTTTPVGSGPASTCTNTPGSRLCGPCPPMLGTGTLASGTGETRCVYSFVNPCLTNNGGCSPLVQCTYEGNGLRVCGPCPKGFTGDGHHCEAINACNTVPNGGCDPLTQCIPTSGSRICGRCPAGYSGTGLTGCTVADPCAPNNGGCPVACLNGATAATVGAYQCLSTCPAGFAPNATGECLAVNSCAANNGGCDANAMCTSTGAGTNSCACNAGFSGNGVTCTPIGGDASAPAEDTRSGSDTAIANRINGSAAGRGGSAVGAF